jgi:hypothetical protein
MLMIYSNEEMPSILFLSDLSPVRLPSFRPEAPNV